MANMISTRVMCLKRIFLDSFRRNKMIENSLVVKISVFSFAPVSLLTISELFYDEVGEYEINHFVF